MSIKTLSSIAGIAVLVAILPWPYGYYTILRLFICIASIIVAVQFNKVKKTGWVWTFSILAILFNPIIPFYSTKFFWILVDIATAILFFKAPKIIENTS